MNHETPLAQGPVDVTVGRRPSEATARAAIEAWLDEHAPGYPAYSLCEDGDEDSAENKCGWAFWVCYHDTTSYLHEDLTVEWYGTGWPENYEYDGDTGNWMETTPNAPAQPTAPGAELSETEADRGRGSVGVQS